MLAQQQNGVTKLLSSPSHALTWFANGSLLDAQMTRSISSNLLGKDPAFSPDHVIRTGLLFNNDRLNMALTATIVDDHYWQDSNLPRGTGAATIAAKVPAYEVLDLTGEYRLAANWELYSGINNLLNERYYSFPCPQIMCKADQALITR